MKTASYRESHKHNSYPLRESFVTERPGWGLSAGQWLKRLREELRPQQWVKNFFVLIPLLFSQNLFSLEAAVRAFAAFGLFCLVSSSVYVLNDIQDREQDRLHPKKRHRPIAAGELGVGAALGIMGVLLVGGLIGGVLIDPTFALILSGYWFLNLLYSTWLKHQVLLDVFIIAAGFVLRVVGGGAAIHVEISHWLLMCTTLLALFLGFSKRRHELTLLGTEAGEHRQVLEEYDVHFLDMMIGIIAAATVMSYALYTVSEETVRKFQTDSLLLTLPFVLYGFFRYLYLVYHKDQGGDPTQTLLTDGPTAVNLCLWAVAVGVILYWR